MRIPLIPDDLPVWHAYCIHRIIEPTLFGLRGETKMRNKLTLVLAVLSLGVSHLAAGQWDKLTKLDVKETIMIPGKQLPPGKYVMKLMDSPSDRHIVMIFNEDQSKLVATVLAIPNSRLQPTGDTVLQYWETPTGVPPALRAWFYPGDNFGQEFAYPKAMAAELSRVNNAKVMYYDGPDRAENTVDTFKDAQLYDAPGAKPEAVTVAAASPAAVADSSANSASSVEAKPEPAATPAPEPQPAAVNTAPRSDPAPVLMAQNRTPDAAPVAAAEQLPQTASNVPAMMLFGLALVAVGGAMRFRQVRQ